MTDETLVEQAYTLLRRAILQRTFRPGMKLSTLSLSREMGISRTPVRLALQSLASEGLVEMRSNQTPQVANPSARTVQEIFYMRCLLEPEAAALACGSSRREELAEELRQGAEAERRAFSKRLLDDYLEANERFHSTIAGMCGNETLATTIRPFLARSTVILSLFDPFYEFSEDEEQRIIRENRALVAAIGRGDGQWARETMRNHIETTYRNLPVHAIEEATRTVARLK
ncbi:MAG: GntR family transcriptional regulator [Synergistales bacterium]|nr:GntR family transcriptional regulator [Synergistales bacterium]